MSEEIYITAEFIRAIQEQPEPGDEEKLHKILDSITIKAKKDNKNNHISISGILSPFIIRNLEERGFGVRLYEIHNEIHTSISWK
jgi:hypothetical protein